MKKPRSFVGKLITRGFNCRLVDAKGNYLFVDGKYERQSYAIPVAEIKGYGDVGFNVEVYDSDTSMIDLYSKGDSLRNVLDKAGFSEMSQMMMLSIYVEESQVSLLIDLLFVLRAIGRLPHYREA